MLEIKQTVFLGHLISLYGITTAASSDIPAGPKGGRGGACGNEELVEYRVLPAL